MKSLFMIAVAAVMVLSFSMAGFAATQSVSTGSQTMATGKTAELGHKTRSGKVVSYDQTRQAMVVKGTVVKKNFDVCNATMSGVVKPRQKVHVTHIKENDQMVASTVSSGVHTAMHHAMKMRNTMKEGA
jgi:hypothetical protein